MHHAHDLRTDADVYREARRGAGTVSRFQVAGYKVERPTGTHTHGCGAQARHFANIPEYQRPDIELRGRERANHSKVLGALADVLQTTEDGVAAVEIEVGLGGDAARPVAASVFVRPVDQSARPVAHLPHGLRVEDSRNESAL